MLKQKFFIASFLILIYQSSYAIFCPNNFSSINYGDALQSVIQTCGQPSSQSTYMKNEYASQEWVYYVNEGYMRNTSMLSVIFNNDHIVNMTLTGNEKVCAPNTGSGKNNPCIPIVTERTRSIASTQLCGGLISLGDNSQTVNNACGKPVFTNIQQGAPDKQTPVTTLNYSGPPPTQLIFENGVLTNRVQGQ